MMESKNIIPVWTFEEKSLPTSCILGSCTMGIVFLAIGSVLTAMFRKITVAADLAMGGVALIVLGVVLILTGSFVGLGLLFARKGLPKISSAAKADMPPDPFSLVPMYPSCSGSLSTDATCSSQIMLLPGGVDPVYAGFGT